MSKQDSEVKDNKDAFIKSYKILRPIGKGNYGTVFVCTDPAGNEYVLKRVNLACLSDLERQRSQAEATFLSHVNHPCIVRYVENFLHEGDLCIVMEFCSGGDLSKAKSSQLTEEKILEWFCQIALAIQHCHARKILHRDLKLQNIYICSDGRVKLGDFGISKLLDSTMDMASTVVGTPYSMSPEVCQSNPYSYMTDIWALGCILFELCTSKHPFTGNGLLALVRNIVQEPTPQIPSNFSPELQELINDMLAKDPKQRPSINEVCARPIIKRSVEKFCAQYGFNSATILSAPAAPLPATPGHTPSPSLSDASFLALSSSSSVVSSSVTSATSSCSSPSSFSSVSSASSSAPPSSALSLSSAASSHPSPGLSIPASSPSISSPASPSLLSHSGSISGPLPSLTTASPPSSPLVSSSSPVGSVTSSPSVSALSSPARIAPAYHPHSPSLAAPHPAGNSAPSRLGPLALDDPNPSPSASSLPPTSPKVPSSTGTARARAAAEFNFHKFMAEQKKSSSSDSAASGLAVISTLSPPPTPIFSPHGAPLSAGPVSSNSSPSTPPTGAVSYPPSLTGSPHPPTLTPPTAVPLPPADEHSSRPASSPNLQSLPVAPSLPTLSPLPVISPPVPISAATLLPAFLPPTSAATSSLVPAPHSEPAPLTIPASPMPQMIAVSALFSPSAATPLSGIPAPIAVPPFAYPLVGSPAAPGTALGLPATSTLPLRGPSPILSPPNAFPYSPVAPTYNSAMITAASAPALAPAAPHSVPANQIQTVPQPQPAPALTPQPLQALSQAAAVGSMNPPQLQQYYAQVLQLHQQQQLAAELAAAGVTPVAASPLAPLTQQQQQSNALHGIVTPPSSSPLTLSLPLTPTLFVSSLPVTPPVSAPSSSVPPPSLVLTPSGGLSSAPGGSHGSFTRFATGIPPLSSPAGSPSSLLSPTPLSSTASAPERHHHHHRESSMSSINSAPLSYSPIPSSILSAPSVTVGLPPTPPSLNSSASTSTGQQQQQGSSSIDLISRLGVNASSSVATQYIAIQQQCQRRLGPELFEQIYLFLQSRGNAGPVTDETLKSKFGSSIDVRACKKVEHLVFLEGQLKHGRLL